MKLKQVATCSKIPIVYDFDFAATSNLFRGLFLKSHAAISRFISLFTFPFCCHVEPFSGPFFKIAHSDSTLYFIVYISFCCHDACFKLVKPTFVLPASFFNFKGEESFQRLIILLEFVLYDSI